jgi:hypothetical protein
VRWVCDLYSRKSKVEVQEMERTIQLARKNGGKCRSCVAGMLNSAAAVAPMHYHNTTHFTTKLLSN